MDWKRLRGTLVTVQAAGVTYRGIVVEAGETSLLLRASTGFREIPWERITKVEDARPEPLARPSALSRFSS